PKRPKPVATTSAEGRLASTLVATTSALGVWRPRLSRQRRPLRPRSAKNGPGSNHRASMDPHAAPPEPGLRRLRPDELHIDIARPAGHLAPVKAQHVLACLRDELRAGMVIAQDLGKDPAQGNRIARAEAQPDRPVGGHHLSQAAG